MRARTSTIGLNAGWVVTSSTRSPSIQTSRPSRIDSRYSSPVLIIGNSAPSSSVFVHKPRRSRLIVQVGLSCRLSSDMTMIDPSSRFTLRQLSCFIATCERGGIGAAAEHLHLAQATVSAALADLERALGAQLLVRGRRRAATPSPAGRELLAEARAVLAAAARLGERAATLRGEVAGELPVGCLVTLAPVVAPAVCREFERRWPHAQVRLLPADQEALLHWLGDGTIALALTYDLGLDGDLD